MYMEVIIIHVELLENLLMLDLAFKLTEVEILWLMEVWTEAQESEQRVAITHPP